MNIYKRFRNDTAGDVLGLPLYIFILLIVVGLGLAIILGWFLLLDDPPKGIGEIKVEAGGKSMVEIPAGQDDVDITITVEVWDKQDKKISGAVVEISGAGIQNNAVTDSSGTATFSNANVELPPGTETSQITVKVTKDGYGKKETTIIVRRLH